ncbi:unnamed protein product [Musa acuminata subsp. burmannicoides]
MLCWCSSLLCFILRMAFFAQEDKSKLASNGSKSLPELLRKACAQCHGSGLRTLSNLSSVDESTLDSDLDHKQRIILEIRSRAMKTKSRPHELLFSGKLARGVSPTTGRADITGEEEHDDDDESEAFFSVKSCFSCCSTDGSTELEEFGSLLGEFRHCEGWPFGLRRRAVALPPLPSSPSDSWMWHKRNLVTRTSPKSLALKP